MYFSIIIPVFNRPDEVDELLKSLVHSTFQQEYEIVIVEDGSTIPCKNIVARYQSKLNITYFNKPNTGPGDSRNYGMEKARGNYFIIFDSDCLIPPQYLETVAQYLEDDFVDCFGGPDKADDSFTDIQKAVDFTMTSVLTTGGIRGASETLNKFQPRSFNMGISKTAFEASGGFGTIHPGEDPDLSIRLWKMGFHTKLLSKAFVYHKRRISWEKFYQQVHKFGLVRPILNNWHPEYAKVTFLFPSLFIIGFAIAIILSLNNFFIPILCYVSYFLLIFVSSYVWHKDFKISFYAVYAAVIQFYGYGSGFLISLFHINVLRQNPKKAFPKLFFK